MKPIIRKRCLPVWLLFPTAFLLLTLFPPRAIAQCYDHDPLDMKHKTPVKCPMVTDSKSLEKRQELLSAANSTNMFQVLFTCGINNKNTCNKVKNAFLTAGKIITATLVLKSPIIVNATYMDFCKSMGDCGSSQGYLTLGGAAPARTIPMKDLDGKQRFYPQALVKQFGYDTHRQFTTYDITALFNSVTNFWFDSDPNPITPAQSDFLFVILHELIHGLGFTSSWDDYLNVEPEALTPDLGEGIENGRSTYQFVEYAFDQYMVVIPQNRNATSYTDALNTFSTSSRFSDIDTFANAFVESSQYDTAKTMFKYAITKNSLGFLLKGAKSPQDALILETSLDPYQQGSSISHVDYKTYTNTSDFLMRYLQDRGVSLQDAILAGGNYKGGPIGPKLKMVLETLGYATQDNPNPYKPLPSSSNTSSKYGGYSSAISYKIFRSSSFQWRAIAFILLAWFSPQILLS
ncbi:hypothetical protein G9A89_014271 [Geosiphon pyriformis]|nr:hypothetical protein G9A89_014271 [Geosiphon pyriformis]